jgi:hypothetical protein
MKNLINKQRTTEEKNEMTFILRRDPVISSDNGGQAQT